MRRPYLQILLAIGLLLIANYYWRPATDTALAPPALKDGKKLPTSYIDKARSRSYATDGTLSDILESERVEQFGRTGYAMLTQPRFYAHSATDRTWTASADRGRFEVSGQRLLLRNNVVLTHDQTGTQLNTRNMNIHLDLREAESKTPVTITQGENRTKARGMLARLNEETLTLGPQVESIYAPQH